MADMSEQILDLFRKEPLMELCTTDIVKRLYTDEYEKIKTALHDPVSSKEIKVVAKRHKAQLHRRVLYHLNSLISEKQILVTNIHGKGEKYFGLHHHASHGVQRRQEYSLLETQPLLKLERYHQQKVISSFDSQNWHTRLNALLLEVQAEDTTATLYARISKIVHCVNDVIGLAHFERVVETEDLDTLISFIKKCDIDTRDNNKRISLHLDIALCKDAHSFLDFIHAYSLLNPPHIAIVFVLTPDSFVKYQRMVKAVAKDFSDSSIKIHVQNTLIHKAPILIGQAGVYTIDDKEWDIYCSEVRGSTIGLCYAQVSVCVDISRLLLLKKNHSEIREFFIKLTRSLVESSTLQRRTADLSFQSIHSLNKSPHDFFRFAVNHIRLWNYDWEDEQLHFSDLMHTTAQEVDKYSNIEETIFKSCGIPIRFKTSLSSAFSKFKPGFFSKRTYTKISIHKSEQLDSDDVKHFLALREQLITSFKHNDRIRIFRTLPAAPDDIVFECKKIISSYSIPLLTYDFSKRKEDLTLQDFMT